MKFLLGIGLGIFISSLVFIFYLYPSIKNNWQTQGFNEGEIAAKIDIATSLRDQFGPYEEEEILSELFNIKTISVYIVECDDEKTIRVHE